MRGCWDAKWHGGIAGRAADAGAGVASAAGAEFCSALSCGSFDSSNSICSTNERIAIYMRALRL
jgi:hypothetical protein